MQSSSSNGKTTQAFDVSVILPFRDDEDIVGSACLRLAEHLRGLDLSFELLAIEEDSGDNSHAVLGLLRGKLPELNVLYASTRDRGYATAAQQARGRSVLLIDASSALKPLAILGQAIRGVLGGVVGGVVEDAVKGSVGADARVDAIFAPDRFAVCHRTRTLDALRVTRGRKFGSLRRRLEASGARIHVLGPRRRRWLTPLRRKPATDRPLGRLMAALSLPRF